MNGSFTPQLIAAERLSDGVVIKFENGQAGFFSSAYLFSKLSESKEMDEAAVEW